MTLARTFEVEVGTPKSRGTRDYNERKKVGLNFNTVTSQTDQKTLRLEWGDGSGSPGGRDPSGLIRVSKPHLRETNDPHNPPMETKQTISVLDREFLGYPRRALCTPPTPSR